MTKRIKCPNCGSSNMCNVFASSEYEYYNPVTDNYTYETYMNEFKYSTCNDCNVDFMDKIETMVIDDGAEAQ